MEPANYHSELQSLKQRVSELSYKYSPHLRDMSLPRSTATAPADQFSEQLSDIKRALKSVEQSIASYKGYVPDSHEHYYGTGVHPNPVAGPYGALIRPVVHRPADDQSDIKGRLTALERQLRQSQVQSQEYETRLDELEDKVDGLDPNRFTPASSTAGTELHRVVSAETQRPWKDLSRFPMAQPTQVCELYSDAGQLTDPTPRQISSSLAPEFGLPPPTCSFYPESSYSARGTSNSIPTEMDFQPETEQTRVRNLQLAYIKILEASHDLQKSSVNRAPTGNVREVELPARPHQEHHIRHVSSEGVDFRDREIARLDEQLTIANERLKASEEVVVNKDAYIRELAEAKEGLQKECDDLTSKIAEERIRRTEAEEKSSAKRKILSSLETRFQQLQRLVMESDSAIRGWEDSWHGLNRECRYWQERSKLLDQDWADHSNRQRRELDDAHRKHKEELKRMNSFCADKDLVIGKQQDNIAWAGNLLKQRDEELEDMQKDLRYAESDCERLTRLLAKKTEELNLVKEMSHHGSVDESTTARVTAPSSTLADKASSSDSVIEVINDNTSERQANESETSAAGLRPSLLDEIVHGSIRDKPAGKEATSHAPEHENKRRGRNSGRYKRPHQRQYPEWNKVAMSNQSNGVHFTPEPGASQYGKGSWPQKPALNVSSDFLNDKQPPLPAPITFKRDVSPESTSWDQRNARESAPSLFRTPPRRAHRMVSETNLRASSPDSARFGRNQLSKHRSMMELPKKKSLQAFVEDEVESLEGGRRE